MKNHEIPSAEERLPITSPDAMEQAIRDIEQQEQLYSIALFDILGFSNLVQNNGTQIVLDLYNKKYKSSVRKFEKGNTDRRLPEYHFCCSDFVESYNSTPTKLERPSTFIGGLLLCLCACGIVGIFITGNPITTLESKIE